MNTKESSQERINTRFYTIPQASREVGIPAYKIRRAVKRGVIPSYGVLDRRRYVCIADIRNAMATQGPRFDEQASFTFSNIPTDQEASQ